jgi:uncharacterized protein (TIGR02449 family)
VAEELFQLKFFESCVTYDDDIEAVIIMEELLTVLEKKLKALLEEHMRLKISNQKLHQNKSMIAREKELLSIKQHKAIQQIEDLISKLKTIEKLS